MNALARTSATALFVLLLLAPPPSSAQDQKGAGSGTGSIAGRITIGNKPAVGIAVAVVSKGEFQVINVEAGRYRLDPYSIGETWYIRSITLSSANRSSPTKDLSAIGLSVQTGERIAGLIITLAEGGASVGGRVVQADDTVRVLPGMRVVLVPADGENRDNFLRYAEAAVQSDGAFKIKNIAPGRYWLLARQGASPDMAVEPFRPVVWDAKTKAALRSEAERANVVVELKPCQKITNYSLRVKAPVKGMMKDK